MPTKKRKPFLTTKITEEKEEDETSGGEIEEVDRIDANRPNKVLILNQSNCNRISKFPCTIGEANELLMRQLVTVKFSFNSLPRNKLNAAKEERPKKDYNGNYDVLPLISAEALQESYSINRQLPALMDSTSSNISEDRLTMIERELELEIKEDDQQVKKSNQFDKSVQILYQKYEQRTGSGHPVIGTMVVHQFIAVADLSPSKGFGKLCQICHFPLRSYSTIRCIDCDFKCHVHCQNRVSTIVIFI